MAVICGTLPCYHRLDVGVEDSLLVARVRFGCGPEARPGHPAFHQKKKKKKALATLTTVSLLQLIESIQQLKLGMS